MKIVHVVPVLTRGGAERVAVDLANEFARTEQVSMVAGFHADPGLLQAKISDSVDLRFVTRGKRGIPLYLAAARWIQQNWDWIAGQDIIHCHLTFGSVFGALVTLHRKLRGRGPKVVETYHAVGAPLPLLRRRLALLVAATHDGFVTMATNPEIAGFVRAHPALPYALIPNGIAFDSGRPSPEESAEYRRLLCIPDGVLVIGTVGRIVSDRCPDRIIRIFAEIAKVRDDVRFLMGGKGPEVPVIARLARDLGLNNRLSLPGLVLRPALPFSIMDLYVTLNVGSVTGVAALEAAAAGLPIIALQLDESYAGSGEDWIFSSADPASVADEALRLLDHTEERADLAARQREHVRREHGVDTMAASYRDFYASLLQ